MITEPQIFELHVNPTYAVCIPQRTNVGRPKTEKQIKNEENLKDNKRKSGMSRKAVRRLTNAINWLVTSASTKYVYDKKTNKRYNFKINFITLTLPTIDHGITDHYFKSKLLHGFINQCRVKYGLKNFVWKVEAQKNGNIHAHFTTDTFIHHADVRRTWNKILSKHGLIDKYQQKHIGMSLDEYVTTYSNNGKRSIDRLKTAYYNGIESNWTNPNSTDVRSVVNVKNIAGYLAKYMVKKEVGRREIKGRVWSCSYNLSSENKLVIELAGSDFQKYMDDLFKPEIKFSPIQLFNEKTRKIYNLGEIFFYKLNDWGTQIKGALFERFNEHRFNIRHGIDVKAKLDSLKEIIRVKEINSCPFAGNENFVLKELPF